MQTNPITEAQLDNGLRVVLQEMHHAPVISWWVFYRVGSRNELPGITGASHWCEHMMFKGTPQFPNGALDRMVSREGGVWNAYTWVDFTAYYETMPAGRIDLALRLEADRMNNALFTPQEVEAERNVIISERQGAENAPLFWLREELQAAMFRVHPYHHEVIGDMVDLETMTRDDLHGYYSRYYRPNNAVAVAVGDFQTDDMLARIQELYAHIPAGEPVPPVVRTEPTQRGERRVRVEREGTTAFVALAVHAPRATDDDYFRLTVLDSVLAGSSASTNKTSRLYRALVAPGLAAHAYSGLSSTIDPYAYTLTATVNHGRSPAEVEAAMVAEVERLLREPVSDAELAKAKKQAKAYFAYESERITDQANWIGTSHMVAGNTAWLKSYLERLIEVTAEDIQDLAQRYLQPSRRTFGWFVPILSA